MAHTLSAKKRIRQSEKRKLINKSNKTRMRNTIKKFIQATDDKNVENAEILLRNAISTICKTARKGTIHKKQAARRVSRLTLKLNALKSK